MGHFKQKSSCGFGGGLTVTFKDESARRLLPKIGKLKKTLYTFWLEDCGKVLITNGNGARVFEMLQGIQNLRFKNFIFRFGGGTQHRLM